jgi:pyrophosphatase PpaX
MAVVTSKSRDAVELAQRILPPPVPFDAVVTAEDTERHKPGPEPILHALELLGGTPSDAVYVGDARYDVLAARAAGVAAVAVTWGAGDEDALRAAGPDAVVGTPAELAAVLGVGEPDGA